MSNNPVIFCKAALCSLFVVVFAAVASGADGICVRVSPEGPLASPEAALAEVRRQRAIGGRDDVVATIEFGKGVYRISRTLALTAADSYLVMRGAGDGKTVFSGAREIRGFTRAADGTFRAPVPAGFTFDQLWVNGRRSCRARSPNKGYFYIRDSVDETVDPETGKPANLDRKAYLFAKKDAAQLAALGRDELSKVIVHVTYAWDEDFVRPSFADAATGIIKFCNEFGRSPMWGRWMTRCRFENFRSALDAPGEWFLDVKAGELLYVPRVGENPESTVAEAPVLSALVTVAGADGKPVRNVTFSGISFEHQGWKCGKTFFTGQSAAALQEAMVTADQCEGVRFERCGFSHTSSYALWFRDSCHDCSVSKSHFRDLGAGGVRLSRPLKVEIDRSLVTSRIAVDDNIIHDAGHLFQCGVGVLLQHAYDCRILHNEIFDVKYTGISHGWRWSYGKQHCGGHEIGYNHIHHLGKNEMCDMGGIYSLGPSPGTRVHNNWVHDVRSYLYTGAGGTGLYTDEGSTGIVF